MDPADALLVRKARTGDRQAFEELVRRFTRLVYARVYLETGDSHRAEDIVQETFLRAYRAFSQLADPEGFKAWLLSIAHAACVDAARADSRKKRAGPRAAVEVDTLPGGASEPADEAEREEARRQVLTVLRSMPEGYREPIMLRFFLGCDYHTIAGTLGLADGQLRGMLNRGMQMLRDEMKKVSRM